MKSMKYILCVALTLFGLNIASAQMATNTELNDSTNIYRQSFELFCKQKIEKTDVLLVEENSFITKNLPSECLGQQIKIINIVELQKILKTKNEVQLIRIVPLRVKDGDFFVNIIVFNVSLIHKQFNFVNIGGVSIVFNYYEVSKTFKFKEIR
jgi:hypothetical protein